MRGHCREIPLDWPDGINDSRCGPFDFRDRAHEFQSSGDLPADADSPLQIKSVRQPLLQLNFQLNRLSGTDQTPKLGVVLASDDRHLGIINRELFRNQHSTSLKTGFALQHPREDRKVGIVPLKNGQIGGQMLGRHNLVLGNLRDLIQPEERRPMRNARLYFVDVHILLFGITIVRRERPHLPPAWIHYSGTVCRREPASA